MKKQLFVDVDDVLLQWIPDFNEHIGQSREYIPKAWGYPELGVKYETVKAFIANGPMHPAIEQNVQRLNKLHDRGWDVILVTSHPTNMTMERIRNLKAVGVKFDHLVCTLLVNPDGSQTSVSKAFYIKEVYGDVQGYKILVDDRLKSVNEFVKMGVGLGVSIDRAYNDKDLEELQNDNLLKKRVMLGRGDTYTEQAHDMFNRLEELVATLECPVAAIQRK